jgi:hypothetical protein
VAYDIFFNKKSESAVDDQVVFCQAIRYGRIGNGYIMQSYSGSGLGRNVIFNECVHLFPDKHSPSSPTPQSPPSTRDFRGARIAETKSEPEILSVQFSFDDLIAMIESDSQRNLKRNEQNILWWVDLTCEEKSAGIVNLMIHKFGVPRELEESLHSNRLSSLSDERMGFGVNTMRTAERGRSDKAIKPPVKSFNVTVQSIWLKNLPVIQIQPDWISRYNGRLKQWIMSLFVRFAPFLSYSHAPDHEKVGFIRHVAESLENHCHSSNESTGLAVPPPPKRQQLDFLLKPHDVEKRGLPVFEANTLSLHLLDLGTSGSSPNCVLTFNQIEDESDITPQFRGKIVNNSGGLGRTKEAIKSLLLNVILLFPFPSLPLPLHCPSLSLSPFPSFPCPFPLLTEQSRCR